MQFAQWCLQDGKESDMLTISRYICVGSEGNVASPSPQVRTGQAISKDTELTLDRISVKFWPHLHKYLCLLVFSWKYQNPSLVLCMG
jgi:hypothetical protein